MAQRATERLMEQSPDREAFALALLQRKLRDRELPAIHSTLRGLLRTIGDQVRALEHTLSETTGDGRNLVPEPSKATCERLNALFTDLEHRTEDGLRTIDHEAKSASPEKASDLMQQFEEMLARWRDVETPVAAIATMIEGRRQRVKRLLERLESAHKRLETAQNELQKLKGDEETSRADEAHDARWLMHIHQISQREKKVDGFSADREKAVEKRARLQDVPIGEADLENGNGSKQKTSLDDETDSLADAIESLADPIDVQSAQEAFHELYAKCLESYRPPQEGKQEEKPDYDARVLAALKPHTEAIHFLYDRVFVEINERLFSEEDGDEEKEDTNEGEEEIYQENIMRNFQRTIRENADYRQTVADMKQAIRAELPPRFGERCQVLVRLCQKLKNTRESLDEKATSISLRYRQECDRLKIVTKRLRKRNPHIPLNQLALGHRQKRQLDNLLNRIIGIHGKELALDIQRKILGRMLLFHMLRHPLKSVFHIVTSIPRVVRHVWQEAGRQTSS